MSLMEISSFMKVKAIKCDFLRKPYDTKIKVAGGEFPFYSFVELFCFCRVGVVQDTVFSTVMLLKNRLVRAYFWVCALNFTSNAHVFAPKQVR